MSGLGTLHTDTYFARMRHSLGDKARILDHLVPGSVLDLGAGDGSFVRLLREHGWDAIGVDASAEAVARSGGTVLPGRIEQVADLFGARRFDNVVFGSVLHEVWSYAEGDRDLTWSAAVRAAAGLLNPGGRLVVRDGVGPRLPEQRWRLQLRDPEDAGRFLDSWAELAEPLLGAAALERVGDALVGPAWLVTEFLLTYNWGWASLPREGLEFYTVAGPLQRHAGRLVEVSGLELLLVDSWLQEGYRTSFERIGTLARRDGDGWVPADWPDSNAVWVLGRPVSARGIAAQPSLS